MKKSCVIQVPCGKLKITATGTHIIRCDWVDDIVVPPSTLLLKKAVYQINEYFNRERKIFELPLEMKGSAFEESVWNIIASIPYGKTVSYSEIARKIGDSNAVRAVGNACGHNPISIIVPCHRVTAKNNNGGYTGGIHLKYALWDVEQIKGKGR